MRLSYVIISWNRKDTLLANIARLGQLTNLRDQPWDIWVVDNGSTDGTASAVREQFPWVRLIALEKNEGMPARNHAFNQCAGEYIICLDDDSYPIDADVVPTMLDYMDAHPGTAALVANVKLADGSYEAPAMPAVLMGGATCFRRSVLSEVGGYSSEFFRQAEEYDLSFRIWGAGYRIERFEDCVFFHEKVAGPGRASETVQFMDLRNNLIVADRYLPEFLKRVYREDWAMRYGAIGRSNGFESAMTRANLSAWVWKMREALSRKAPLHFGAIESIFGLHQQSRMVGQWARLNKIKRVVIADFSKNLYATYAACQDHELDIRAIADNGPAFTGLEYRGVRIQKVPVALRQGVDGVVISNTNPAQIEKRIAAVREWFSGPILRLWEPKYLAAKQVKLRIAA